MKEAATAAAKRVCVLMVCWFSLQMQWVTEEKVILAHVILDVCVMSQLGNQCLPTLGAYDIMQCLVMPYHNLQVFFTEFNVVLIVLACRFKREQARAGAIPSPDVAAGQSTLVGIKRLRHPESSAALERQGRRSGADRRSGGVCRRCR